MAYNQGNAEPGNYPFSLDGCPPLPARGPPRSRVASGTKVHLHPTRAVGGSELASTGTPRQPQETILSQSTIPARPVSAPPRTVPLPDASVLGSSSSNERRDPHRQDAVPPPFTVESRKRKRAEQDGRVPDEGDELVASAEVDDETYRSPRAQYSFDDRPQAVGYAIDLAALGVPLEMPQPPYPSSMLQRLTLGNTGGLSEELLLSYLCQCGGCGKFFTKVAFFTGHAFMCPANPIL
ncbi:hypothetical protein C8Q80DRAFT_1124095 [Daedaleopsis nitida]|nr:hypothetical protein C8Q80DRAFT_1124095 [Daedaleopsis nitida]